MTHCGASKDGFEPGRCEEVGPRASEYRPQEHHRVPVVRLQQHRERGAERADVLGGRRPLRRCRRGLHGFQHDQRVCSGAEHGHGGVACHKDLAVHGQRASQDLHRGHAKGAQGLVARGMRRSTLTDTRMGVSDVRRCASESRLGLRRRTSPHAMPSKAMGASPDAAGNQLYPGRG